MVRIYIMIGILCFVDLWIFLVLNLMLHKQKELSDKLAKLNRRG